MNAVLSVGHYYRGVLIHQDGKDPEPCAVFDESNREYRFISTQEAEAFVDASLERLNSPDPVVVADILQALCTWRNKRQAALDGGNRMVVSARKVSCIQDSTDLSTCQNFFRGETHEESLDRARPDDH